VHPISGKKIKNATMNVLVRFLFDTEKCDDKMSSMEKIKKAFQTWMKSSDNISIMLFKGVVEIFPVMARHIKLIILGLSGWKC
jgi:hypothetical protein